MRPQVIRKIASEFRVAPNLQDTDADRADFSWDSMRHELAGLPGGGLNIAYEAVDRHADGARAKQAAFRWLPREGPERTFTYAELKRLTDRFANVLRGLSAGKGDRLFVLAGRIPELYVGVLGGLKTGMTVSPLFSAFGPEPIRTRIEMGEGKILLTTESLYRRKVEKIRASLPR